MDDEGLALARALVALPGWRWMPGMLGMLGGSEGGPSVRVGAIEDGGNALQEYGWLPDLDDPATGGVLESMLGPDCRQLLEPMRDGWVWRNFAPTTLGRACASVMVERGWVTHV